jgi:hypothetical protein
LGFLIVVAVDIVSPPLYCVLLGLLDEANALQHVRDVVYAPLLDVEGADCLVEVDGFVGGLFDELDELGGEH